jgi:Mn-dependent DtxR family transcriptional regulator
MGRNSLTQDESCLIKLYQDANKDKVWTIEELQTLFRQPVRRTSDMVKNLARANFLTKVRDEGFMMGKKGIELAESLLERHG